MNKDKRNNIQLLGTLNNSDESGIIANANQVYDANEDKSTQDVSKEHKERIETLETKESSMQTTLENITKTGEASAASNVTYNHNDSKLDATNVQQAVDELALGAIYDVSAKNPTGGSNNDGKWESLSALLSDANLNTLIPTAVRKGGMSIKFVQSSDNKYVQFRCMTQNFTTDVANWQGVDDVPTAGSDNLVKSGGVAGKINELNLKINPLSDNQTFNDAIKEMYTSEDLSDVRAVQIAKAVPYNGKYVNLIRLWKTDNNAVAFCGQNYNTQEEALANLKPFYEKNGNYCVIDWNKISVGQNYNANIVLNHERVANLEFNPYIAGYIQGKILGTEIQENANAIQENANDIKSIKLKINPLSNNQFFNDTIKEIYTTVDTTDVRAVQIAKAVPLGNKYINLIRLRKSGDNWIEFHSKTYDSQEETLANLKSFYKKDENYCVIDWNKISVGQNYNANIVLNHERVANLEFNPYIAGYIQGKILGTEIQENANAIQENANIAKNGNSNSLFKSGVVNYQKPNTDIINFIIYGQSLSTGQQTCPELSRENYKGNLMIGQYEWIYGTGNNTRDSITPLKAISIGGENYIPTNSSDQTNGETPNVNFANGAKCMLDGYILNLVDRKILACSCGSGGQSIELLSKNCPNNSGARYNQFTATLNTIKALVDAENKTLSCGCIIWMQGEYNASAKENQGWQQNTPATNNKDDYKAYLLGGITSDGVTHNGLINDMIEDVLTIYQQNTQPIILCSQIGPGFNKAFDNPIDMALLEANNESDLITLVAPSYCVTDRSAHLDPNGTRWIGEYYNKVWYNKVVLGNDWKPLQPNKITKGKNYLDIRFDVPVPPLKFDTHLVRERPNYGFSVKSNSSSISISNIKIISNDTVRITSDTDFEGDVEVAYATINVVYGNLRDSDPWQSFAEYKNLDEVVQNPEGVSYLPSWQPTDEEGNIIYNKKYPCYNWCLKFYYKILSSENVLNINT